MSIRILHIVGIMNMGGLENLIMNVYRKINRDCIQFDFLVTREDEGIFDEEIRNLGGKVYNIPHMSKVGYFKYRKLILEFFKIHPEYKIIHCHRDALCANYLIPAKKCHIPIRIAHSHNINISEQKNISGLMITTFKKAMSKFINKNATHYFACSKEAGEWLFGFKIANTDLQVIKNGISLSNYTYIESIKDKLKKEIGVSQESILLGHVGRFCIQKNHTFLLEVFKKISDNVPNAVLCLVGEGPLMQKVKKHAQKLGIEEKVVFLGIRRDVNFLMMAFDLFLFPSLYEGLGIVLIEAQATGLPCLVSDEIPLEADMKLGLMTYISINNEKEWVLRCYEMIQSMDKIRNKRKSNHYQIMQNGYDIETTSKYLEKFYIEQYSKI